MIEFNNVSVSFNGKSVLRNLNLSFGDGITAVVGQSGYGKTTVLRLAGGLIKPNSGVVITDYSRPSFVFQEQRLLNWYSALRNVTVVNSSADERDAIALLESLGICGEDIYKHPQQLSGGMRQRVCIARALFYGGDILLLDEPFNGLDSDNRERAVELIKQAANSKPVIIVSHIPEDALIADKIIDLETCN